MLQQIYTTFDNKGNIFGRPAYFDNEKLAIAALTHFVNVKENNMNFIEFDLFHIGQYDQNTGKHVPITPKHMFNLQTLKESK